MAKQEIPQVEKKLEELTKEEMVERLASFKEVLKQDKFKDIDLQSIFGVTSKNTGVDPNLAQELINKYNDVVKQMNQLGIPVPKEVKMSEAERALAERIEKQAVAKFTEQRQEVLKLDPDFPIDIIDKLDVSTDDKIVLMSACRQVVQRNNEAIDKIRKELDNVNAQLKEVKMRAPQEPKDTESAETVDKYLKEFGLNGN